MASLLNKIGNALKSAADKVGDVLKVAAPAALTIIGKSGLVPGGSALATLGASLLNKTNAPKATPEIVTQAKAAVLTNNNIGQFQGSSAVVKSVPPSPGAAPQVSVPINSAGIGQFQQTKSLATVVTSGDIIASNGNVIMRAPSLAPIPRPSGGGAAPSALSVNASLASALPISPVIRDIQEKVGIIFGEQGNPQPTNNPQPKNSDMPAWLVPVAWIVGIGLLLWAIGSLIFGKRKR